MYKLGWHPEQENLANYQSKHHAMSHHINVCPWYLHMENSPRFLQRAQKPSALKGCVGTLDDGYVRNVPLPRAPRIMSASHVTCHGAVTHDGSTPLHSTLQVNSTPCYSTCIQADPRIQNACHVPCHGAITHDGSTPLHSTLRVHSTPLHSTCIQADPQIRQACHVTCYGVITHDGYTPLHSTPYVYIPAAPDTRWRSRDQSRPRHA
jgi:hypothetical protein